MSPHATTLRRRSPTGRKFASIVFLILAVPAWGFPNLVDAPKDPSLERWQTLFPQPKETQFEPGHWNLDRKLTVHWGPVAGSEMKALADRLERMLSPLGRTWAFGKPGQAADLTFVDQGPSAEGYHLKISSQGAEIDAQSPQGRYYALITLTQLLPPFSKSYDRVVVHNGQIDDAPSSSWRGLMLDSSRHFQSIETIESILELMALHKLNRFHWHLTDDQGWRLPVQGWPLLTSVGGWRTLKNGQKYGGSYSVEDIQKIVAFADQRDIVVIPEVDLPGHASAALAAYPQLSSNGKPRSVPTDWAVSDGVLGLDRPEITGFVRDVLETLKTLFPGPWIHWGGDEVYRHPWLKTLAGRKWMRAHHLRTGDEAVSQFWTQLAELTVAQGKIPIGWDEVANFPCPEPTVIQWWDTTDRPLKALRQNRPLVVSWKLAAYFDYPEWGGDGDRAAWMPLQPEAQVATARLTPKGASKADLDSIIGYEAILFTERVTQGQWGRKLFPRLALWADRAWNGGKALSNWKLRIQSHRERLAEWGVGMDEPVR